MIKYILPFLLLAFFSCNAQVGENIIGVNLVNKCHDDGSGTLTP